MRIVIAGQFPPPVTGQNVMIFNLFSNLKKYSKKIEIEHLPLNFSKNIGEMRKVNVGKIYALIKVILGLLNLRKKGEIDLIVYPAGGPQRNPIIRDILLLPWIYLFCKKVVIHFHAAGISETAPLYSWVFQKLAKQVYRHSSLAIVMTKYCVKDPEFLGIKNIEIFPHKLRDEFDVSKVNRNKNLPRILYVGHMDKEKGVKDLILVLWELKKKGCKFECVLAGEWGSTLGAKDFDEMIEKNNLKDCVKYVGATSGDKKKALFGEADILVFPSHALESFGLVQVEGMMWGLPVISPNFRGNAEILGEGKCFSVRDNFLKSFESALEVAIDNPQRRIEVGLENRKRFLEKFSKHENEDELVNFLIKYAGYRQ